MARLALALLCVLAGAAPHARADGPLGPDGSPIDTSAYALDLYRGPVLSSSRVTGMGGAYTAIAEGTEGGIVNPAGVAVRPPQSVDFWDIWYGLGLTYPFEAPDFFNSGGFIDDAGLDDGSFLFFNPGIYLQFWGMGAGLNVEISVAEVTSPTDPDRSLALQFLINHVQVGQQFWDRQLIIAGGLQVARQRAIVHEGRDRHRALAGVGFGAELGVLLRPNHARWRLGGSLFTSTRTRSRRRSDNLVEDDGDLGIGSLTLPRDTINPWRGSLGVAYQFGPRPTNPRVRYVREVIAGELKALEVRKREIERQRDRDLRALQAQGLDEDDPACDERREDADYALAAVKKEQKALMLQTWRRMRAEVRHGWPRRYVLLTADLQLSGSVARGVGIESFFAQTVQRSGERVSLSPHLGVESEVWPNRLKLRAGSYVEPTRVAQSTPRVHGTLGFDLRVLHWDVFGIWPEDYQWQLTAAFDLTRDYYALSVAIGGWY